MPIVAECPNCGKKLKIPDDLVGRTVRCSDCAGTFVAAKPRPAPPPPPSAERADEEFDERPSRREPFHSSAYQRPRGGMLLSFGIISIVLGVLGAVVDTAGLGFSFCLFCCPLLPVWVLALFAMVFCVIGLALGIMSWLMGAGDLKRIHTGVMDPIGRGSTKGGMICGVIGTTLNALVLIVSCVGIILMLAFGAAFLASIPTQPINQPPAGPGPRRFSVPSLPTMPDFLPHLLNVRAD